ncbi:hypothetical protein K458DRAFT_79905 [Lentithecium fluviatile CBS 122367]|uniref:Zn(2)-C6 fungal-type domain-containing protein n=1 Tax=Lentithecium fluviatile CBS 122367 TaxID=1168545 RepID=A0A6G1IU87_9PLEO|nr:hypothetical protein K458DRAFT_79905 [Lentithecium fluviatile CBS 122367]
MTLNFVDVQPQSFLDYAWTSPTPAPPIATKPSKTSRKQNRCCDQCRKGKRACDAAILEDTLLDPDGTAGSPALFHYSDSFGCLAPCGNCEKTRKVCTFQWLREQRIAQATTPMSSAPPTKKRRTQSGSSQKRSGTARQSRGKQAPHTSLSDSGNSLVSQHELLEPGLIFSEFPGVTPSFDIDLSLSPPTPFDVLVSCNEPTKQVSDAAFCGNAPENNMGAHSERDSGNGSDIHDDGFHRSPTAACNDPGPEYGLNTIVRIPRKRRRRRSTSTISAGETPCPILCLAASDLASSANNALLAEGLLKIYHDSFENHLSCWLTERTCPYGEGSDVSLPGDIGPDWNRMYHRVFKLDHSSSVRGRSLSPCEDKAASKAVNLSILSYATQWAHSNRDSKTKYPFHSDGVDGRNGTSESAPRGGSFDRALRVSTWHQARIALRDAAEIESFRVVLALLVFSLTQKPLDEQEDAQEKAISENSMKLSPQTREECGSDSSVVSTQPSDKEVDECEDLLSKLHLTLNNEGPPVHLEQGLRLVHSLRSRMTMTGAFGGRPKKTPRCWKRSRLPTSYLDPDDRATVDLLFWLGIMFDTLSSAMHRRPLVVSLEDSDLPATRDIPSDALSETRTTPAEDLWDEHLFSRQRKLRQRRAVRWPCSYEAATSLLCDAAPVKVLLFRKVTRIQTLLSRHIQGDKMERAIQGALELCKHWRRLYAPFIQDCIENHDRLPARVQSWYICLSSHWHLATLLLADLIDIIDDAELSGDAQGRERTSSRFISNFRELNCRSLSEIARCACPRKDLASPGGNGLHFAMNQEAVLIEPWIVVLVRAFATAAVLLLDLATTPEGGIDRQDAFCRIEHCVRALQYLGRRSDAALAAADLIGAALEKRQGKEEAAMDFMAELWSQ